MSGKWRCNKHPGDLDLLEAMSVAELVGHVAAAQHPFWPPPGCPVVAVLNTTELMREVERGSTCDANVRVQVHDLIAQATAEKRSVYGVLTADQHPAPAIVTLPENVPKNVLWTDVDLARCILQHRRNTAPDKPCVLHFFSDPTGTLPPRQRIH